MTDELKQVFVTPDGQMFNTKAEANDYQRRPLIKEALMALTDKNEELADWLVENQETVVSAFNIGTIKRVTKSEKKKLHAALEAIVAAENKDFAFIAENAEAVEESFRWPTVKRMDDEEKAAAAKKTLMEESENNEELSDWVVANQEQIIEAYSAGKVKREVSPKAQQALAEYRAKKAAQKAAEEAAAAKAAQ